MGDRANNKVLLCTGDGLGNVIQSTPALQILFDKGFTVDVYIPGAPPGTDRLIRSGSTSIVSSQMVQFRNQSYYRSFSNWLVPWPSSVDLGPRYKGKSPGKHLPEWRSLMETVQQSVSPVEIPPAYCNVARKGPWYHQMKQHKAEGKKIVAMCAGGKPSKRWMWKRWPAYKELATWFQTKMDDVVIMFLGTKADDGYSSENTYDLRGQTHLLAAAGLLELADVTIANDCGLAHVSAAVGTQTHIIYGPTCTVKNLPPYNAHIIKTNVELDCQPCQYGKKPECKHECMTYVSPYQVFTQVSEGMSND